MSRMDDIIIFLCLSRHHLSNGWLTPSFYFAPVGHLFSSGWMTPPFSFAPVGHFLVTGGQYHSFLLPQLSIFFFFFSPIFRFANFLFSKWGFCISVHWRVLEPLIMLYGFQYSVFLCFCIHVICVITSNSENIPSYYKNSGLSDSRMNLKSAHNQVI